MIDALAWQPTQRHCLAATAALLGFLVLWPWLAPISSDSRPSGGGDAPPKTSVPNLPASRTFTAIAERPLFSSSRRPSPVSTAVVESGAANRYRLVGLISVGMSRRALVADGARRIEISEGSTLDRWTVTRIEQDRVLLSSPQGDAVLILQRAGADVSAPGSH